MKDFYNVKCLKTKHEFTTGVKEYFILQEGEFDDYFEYVRNLPDEETPLLVGLNDNANITYAINESLTIITDVLSISKNSGSD